MIQRIQSLFLFLAGGASIGSLSVSFAKTAEATASGLFADGSYTILDNQVLTILFIAAGIAAFAAILFYKNRPWQMRVALGVAVLLTAALVAGVYFYTQDAGSGTAQPGIGAGLPVLGIVFALAARRYIRKDENLVRSMDRLR